MQDGICHAPDTTLRLNSARHLTEQSHGKFICPADTAECGNYTVSLPSIVKQKLYFLFMLVPSVIDNAFREQRNLRTACSTSTCGNLLWLVRSPHFMTERKTMQKS
jgi:hypothetical protein